MEILSFGSTVEIFVHDESEAYARTNASILSRFIPCSLKLVLIPNTVLLAEKSSTAGIPARRRVDSPFLSRFVGGGLEPRCLQSFSSCRREGEKEENERTNERTNERKGFVRLKRPTRGAVERGKRRGEKRDITAERSS